MNRASMLNDIRLMIAEMDNMICKSRPPKNLEVHPGSEKLTVAFIKEGYTWIKSIYDNQYAGVREVRKLLPEELWRRYEAWGDFEDHRESRMLADALAVLRKAVTHNRPGFFRAAQVARRLVKSENKKRVSHKSRNPDSGVQETERRHNGTEYETVKD